MIFLLVTRYCFEKKTFIVSDVLISVKLQLLQIDEIDDNVGNNIKFFLSFAKINTMWSFAWSYIKICIYLIKPKPQTLVILLDYVGDIFFCESDGYQ